MSHKCVDEICRRVMATLEDILEESETVFTCDELVDVQKCFSILEKAPKVKDMMRD